MNKKELLEQLDKNIASAKYLFEESASESKEFWLGWVNAYSSAKYLLEAKLDEPEKVIIPRHVADWIEHHKELKHCFVDALKFYTRDGDRTLEGWCNYTYRREMLAVAWVNGYEVEGEEYYWRLKLSRNADELYVLNDGIPYWFVNDIYKATAMTERVAKTVLGEDFDMLEKVEVTK